MYQRSLYDFLEPCRGGLYRYCAKLMQRLFDTLNDHQWLSIGHICTIQHPVIINMKVCAQRLVAP